MSLLPEDCLIDIFEYLRNDFKSLNSCVRVNRIWNASAISILWSNPWIIEEIDDKIKGKRKQIELIDIYISSLPQKSKNFLQQKGIVMPILSQPFIHNYTSFMRTFNLYIEDCVWTWMTNQKNCSVKEFIQKVELVILHLLQLILKESIIRKIVTYYISSNKATLPKLVDILTKFPEFGTCFSNLQEIECDSTITIIPQVFEKLIPYCKEIKKIVINKYEDSGELGNLIGTQANLQELFIYHENYENFNYLIPFSKQDVFRGMALQSKSLLRLELCFFDFPIHTLGEFENLEELKLIRYGSPFTTRESLAPLATISLKKLKKVSFHNWFLMNIEYFAGFFEHTNEEVREIVIKSSYSIADRQNTGKLINSIGVHCPKLVKLEIPASTDDGYQMKTLLESRNKLQHIVIYNINDDFISLPRIIPNKKILKEPEDGFKENLLQIFTHHSSPNLNNLSISGIEFSMKDIESFLEYRSLISRPILFHYNFSYNKKIKNLLNRYKKRGILLEERTFNRK
ncbi:5253_t:CDS:1 [Funneliformis geosporum]|uniref:2824_t:CDS:1 n=1 Tax=Funneliformis geosporum TaxID=1117311 RepID=A0A9W4WPG5_9GLOM|nr:5253_t:CDS:1 [Funneliformis geosporum]CAI2169152.1 2824_t:CDS:1 [Funneliformis geosporum]